MKTSYLVYALSLVSILLLFIVEQILVVDYIYKTSTKVVVFFFVIFIFHYLTKRNPGYFSTLKMDLKRLKISLGIGIGSFVILLGTYFMLKDFIDFATIRDNLAQKNVTKETFIFIALYIVIGNSFLEELFFRGFVFKNLLQDNRIAAFIYSSFLFSIYHTAIFLTWFNVSLFLLALFGLFAIGMIFNWLNENSSNIFNSWIVHVIADIAIIIIALLSVF
ncbi:CPBP family intramembrane glutamic endopeptidase [Virgibacillus byunsanensis]|uniref:CPBP family intramembrane glutamic endopeptidase n=1 Tax=Virgibacillus byunsanensis TaxID=570945 RepID=A0ABW3LHZ1_9BACI